MLTGTNGVMTESEFIDQYDCNFPYHSIDDASVQISKAGEISTNTTFFVLHEILRAPPQIDRDTKELLLQMWQTEYAHSPIYRLIERVLPAYRLGQTLPEDIVLTRIDALKPHRGQIYALTLLVFAAHELSPVIQERYQQLLDDWSTPAN